MASSLVFDRPIAHRGLHNRANGVIENSASAFEAAIENGFAIECDLQLTSDGVPVVFHDDELTRLTGRAGFVRDLTCEQLTSLPLLDSAGGECPQTFEQMLRQVRGRTLLQVELKRQVRGRVAAVLARKVADLVAAYDGPLVIESFDPLLLILVRTYGYRGKRGIITYRYDQPQWEKGLSDWQRVVLRNLLHYPRTRFDFISCEHSALDLPAIRFFRTRGKPVTSWTVRSPEIAAAVASSADQIVFEGFDPRGA